MENVLVSVVIPIYGVEKYLERCLESVVGQTYPYLEIILVDDGSPDHCPAICDEWAKKDARIKVIHKNNAGLGMARNTGMEQATGVYICFIDSDDYIEKDALESAVSVAVRENADVVCYGFTRINSRGERGSQIIPNTERPVYKGKDVQNIFLPDLIASNPKSGKKSNLHMSAWACLYSLPFINRVAWRFSSERDIISEDVYSHLRLYTHVNKVAVLSKALYCYCENSASLTRTYHADRYIRIRHFYEECIRVCDELNYSSEVYHRLAVPFLSFTISALKQETAAKLKKNERYENVKAILKDDVFCRVLDEVRHDQVGISKRLFYSMARARLYWVCMQLLILQIFGDNIRNR